MADVDVRFRRGTKAQVDTIAKTDGQVLWTTDQGENNHIYTDVKSGDTTERIEIGGKTNVDDQLSNTSTNPLQNKVVTNNFVQKSNVETMFDNESLNPLANSFITNRIAGNLEVASGQGVTRRTWVYSFGLNTENTILRGISGDIPIINPEHRMIIYVEAGSLSAADVRLGGLNGLDFENVEFDHRPLVIDSVSSLNPDKRFISVTNVTTTNFNLTAKQTQDYTGALNYVLYAIGYGTITT